MRCYVNEQEVAPEALARREMNFSQPLANAIPLPYRITLPAQEFGAALEKDFVRAALEEKADATYQKKGEWPIMDRWMESEFASPKQLLIQEPKLLEELIQEAFTMEALDRALPGPTIGLPVFLVNSLDSVKVESGWVHLMGEAYLHPQLQIPQRNSVPVVQSGDAKQLKELGL
jgi:hypothetical protein